MGFGFGWGPATGSPADGPARVAPARETLEARKEQLQAALAAIEKQLEER